MSKPIVSKVEIDKEYDVYSILYQLCFDVGGIDEVAWILNSLYVDYGNEYFEKPYNNVNDSINLLRKHERYPEGDT